MGKMALLAVALAALLAQPALGRFVIEKVRILIPSLSDPNVLSPSSLLPCRPRSDRNYHRTKAGPDLLAFERFIIIDLKTLQCVPLLTQLERSA